MTNDPNLHWDGTRWLRWNGTEWVDATSVATEATYPEPSVVDGPPAAQAPQRRWLWPVVAVGGFLVLGFFVVVGLAAGGGGTTAAPSTSSSASTPATPASPATPSTPDAAEAPAPPAPEAPQLTVSQENAIDKAEDYLSFAAFSKSGLVQQLKFEGFSTADANFAVANIEVDWNEQAAKKAEDYMNMSSFSRSGLIAQLKFEGFTPAQAAYGAKSVGL